AAAGLEILLRERLLELLKRDAALHDGEASEALGGRRAGGGIVAGLQEILQPLRRVPGKGGLRHAGSPNSSRNSWSSSVAPATVSARRSFRISRKFRFASMR